MANYYNYIYTYIILIINDKRLLVTGLCFALISFSLLAQDQSQLQLANEYLLKGEKRKAAELYRDLARKEENIPLIHNNYLDLMLDLGETEEAQSYLKKISKKEPENFQYKLDLGLVYTRSGDINKSDRYFRDLIALNKTSIQRSKILADYFLSHSLAQYSIISLLESRKALGNPYLFCLELAMIYRIQGQKDKMVQEYLSYVTQGSANIQYVKNVLQALLTKPDEQESLEKLLYDKIQEFPDVEVYSDLLIWITMQQKNFYGSFVQARAFDKRYKMQGEKCMEVARVALDNSDYEIAATVYQYVIKEYVSTPNYLLARLGLIHTREAQVRNNFPINPDSVRALIVNYRTFVAQYPDNNNSLEAIRSEASLYAHYLDQKDSSIQLLTKLIANPKTSLYLKSKSKLDLGDIYLLKGELWESTLLYSQVEKVQHENPIGYEAKLKNAKLFYYKGDFKLAQEHLDILKKATTREIANDAMELSMRIRENIAFDSTGEALKEYALVELMLYQNKTDDALRQIKNLKQGVSGGIAFSNQTILDDVYWLEANIRMKRGEFQESIGLLQKILDEYGEDVLADDAYFLQGEIYDRQLKNIDKAMEIYREFLNKFPGSVYAAEARKRFRFLRGDFSESEKQPHF